jgi:hypothetical protein
MHELEASGDDDSSGGTGERGEGLEGRAGGAAAGKDTRGGHSGGYASVAPVAWALIAAVCADGAKDSVVHWRCLSGSTSAHDMAGSALEWFRRAAEESGAGGFQAASANCDWQTPYLNAEALLGGAADEKGDQEWGAQQQAGLNGGAGGKEGARRCQEGAASLLFDLTGYHLEEWGELMYSEIDQADNAVAFYLEADGAASDADPWGLALVQERLDGAIAEAFDGQRAVLEGEAADTGLDARYLRGDLCRCFLKHGALLEQTFGPDLKVLQSFQRAVECDPSDAQVPSSPLSPRA